MDCAPSSKRLRAEIQLARTADEGRAVSTAGPSGSTTIRDYLQRVLSTHVDINGQAQRHVARYRKQRRDAGVAKREEDLASIRGRIGAPDPEAAIAKRRAAAIEATVRVGP